MINHSCGQNTRQHVNNQYWTPNYTLWNYNIKCYDYCCTYSCYNNNYFNTLIIIVLRLSSLALLLHSGASVFLPVPEVLLLALVEEHLISITSKKSTQYA